MLKRTCLVAAIIAGLCVSLLTQNSLLAQNPTPAQSQRRVRVGDWPELRGPNRDGISIDKGLLQTWAEGGPRQLPGPPGVAVAPPGGGPLGGCLLLTRS